VEKEGFELLFELSEKKALRLSSEARG